MPRKQLLKANYETRLKLSDTMEHFIFLKQAQGMSERTISDYQRTFKSFQNVMEVETLDLDSLKEKLMLFFSSRSNKSPATYNKKIYRSTIQ